jgi:hypothetical protein
VNTSSKHQFAGMVYQVGVAATAAPIAYRKTGSGWQTRINADLRKAARKLAG